MLSLRDCNLFNDVSVPTADKKALKMNVEYTYPFYQYYVTSNIIIFSHMINNFKYIYIHI